MVDPAALQYGRVVLKQAAFKYGTTVSPVGHSAALQYGRVVFKHTINQCGAAIGVSHPAAVRCFVGCECTVFKSGSAVTVVVHPATVPVGRVGCERTVLKCGITGVVVVHPATLVVRHVAFERTVCHRGAAAYAVVHPAAVFGGVPGEDAVLDHWVAAVRVHPAAFVCIVRIEGA